MTDALEIIGKIEHGFTLYNPFYEHNLRVTINKLKNDFTKANIVDDRDFAKAFRRYTSLTKAPVDFIMHLVKNAFNYEKPRSSVDSVRRSIGNEHTVAWGYDPASKVCILYTSIYYEGSDWECEPTPLRYGLLLQWKNHKLCKVDKVELGSGKRTSLYESGILFTSNTMKFSIIRASSKLRDHVEIVGLGQHVRERLLDELCKVDNFKPMSDFLKHHTRDYQGVDSMMLDALLKERKLVRLDIDAECTKTVTMSLSKIVDKIIKEADGKFISEADFLRDCQNIKCAIIYGSTNSLYYVFKSVALDRFFFIEINDLKRFTAMYMGNPVESLTEITKIDLTNAVQLSKELGE